MPNSVTMRGQLGGGFGVVGGALDEVVTQVRLLGGLAGQRDHQLGAGLAGDNKRFAALGEPGGISAAPLARWWPGPVGGGGQQQPPTRWPGSCQAVIGWWPSATSRVSRAESQRHGAKRLLKVHRAHRGCPGMDRDRCWALAGVGSVAARPSRPASCSIQARPLRTRLRCFLAG